MNEYLQPRIILDAISTPEPDNSTIDLSENDPIDWYKTPLSLHAAPSYAAGPRKSGVNLIEVSQLGTDDGQNYGLGTKMFTWGSDSTTGAGNSSDPDLPGQSKARVMAVQTPGNGVRIQVHLDPTGLGGFNDKLRLRFWDHSPSVRQVNYAASVVGDPNAVALTEHIGDGVDEYNDSYLIAYKNHLTTVIFWSDVDSYFRMDVTRSSGSSMGQWGWHACILDRAPVDKPIRGAARFFMGFAR